MELLFNKFKEQLIPKNTTGFIFNLNTENIIHKNYKLRKFNIDKGLMKINHEDLTVIEERLISVLMGTREVQTLESASSLELSFVLHQLELMTQSNKNTELPIIDINTRVTLSKSQIDLLNKIANYTLVFINTEDNVEEFCVDTYSNRYTLEDNTIKQFSDETTQPIEQVIAQAIAQTTEQEEDALDINTTRDFIVDEEELAAPIETQVVETPVVADVPVTPVETPVVAEVPVAIPAVEMPTPQVETPVVAEVPVTPVAPVQEFVTPPVAEVVFEQPFVAPAEPAPAVATEVETESSIFDIQVPQIVEDEQSVQIVEQVKEEPVEEPIQEEPALAYELVQEEVEIPVFDNILEEEPAVIEEPVVAEEPAVEPVQENTPQPLPQPTAEDGVTLSAILANPQRFDPQINPSCEGYIFYYDNVQQIFYQYHEPTRDLRINR